MKNKKGLSLLLIVVLIWSAALIMVLGATFLGVGEANIGSVHNLAAQAATLGDGCVELALEELRNDASYSGDTLAVEDGSCILTVLSSGNDRTILVTSTISNVTATATVEATVVSNVVTISSWE